MKYNIPLNMRKQGTNSSGTNIATVPAAPVHYKLQLYSCSKIQAVELSMYAVLDLGRAVQPIGDSNHSKIESERSIRIR